MRASRLNAARNCTRVLKAGRTATQSSPYAATIFDRAQLSNELTHAQAFLAAQALLSLPPILLFLAYVTTLLLASTFAALALALTFVGLAAALASLILIPVLLFTSATATGLFLAGFVAYTVAQKLATDPRLEPARQRAITTAQATGAKAHAAVLQAGQTADALSGGRLEAALAESQKALQTKQSEPHSRASTGVSTPVSQPPSYADQAQSYGASTPLANGSHDSEISVARSTPNAAAERVGFRPFVQPKTTTQSQLSEDEKAGIVRAHSRPALF